MTGPSPFTVPGDLELLDRLRLDVEDGLVGDLLHVGVAHQAHRPAGVVVGGEAAVGEVLLFEQDLGEAAVGLIALDDQRAGRERALLRA